MHSAATGMIRCGDGVASARRARKGRVREKVGKEARKWRRGKKGLEVLALSDVSRVGGHPDELCYVACGVQGTCHVSVRARRTARS